MARAAVPLITSATFRALARKGATADDLAHVSVFKAGRRKDTPTPELARQITFILSNADLDREGDSIAAAGWDLTHYLTNPVVLWAHDHGALPVGRAVKTWMDGTNLLAVDDFVPAAVYPFAETVLLMLRAGFLNACSVGFQPQEWTMSETGINFTQQALLEHSVCPVPAHPGALVIARSQGIDVAPLVAWTESILDLEQRKGDAAVAVRGQLERLRVQSDGRGRTVLGMAKRVKLVPAATVTATSAATYTQWRGTLAGVGVSISVADDACSALLNVPVGTVEEQRAADRTSLDAITASCAAAADGALAVSAQAEALGGAAPKSRTLGRRETAALRRAVRAMRELGRTVKAGRVLSADNEHRLRAAIQELEAILATLGPPDGEKPEPKHILIDGRPITGTSPEFRLEDFDLSDASVRDILERVTRDAMQAVTGRVD